MARRSAIVGLLVAIAVTATSAAAQIEANENIVFSKDRPDGFGPPGVTGHFVMDAGEILWSFTYSRVDMQGNRAGTTPVSVAEVLDIFPVAPLSLLTQTLNLELRMGLTDRLTFAASIPFQFRDAEDTFGQTAVGGFVVTSVLGTFTDDIGDLKLNALLSLLPEGGPHLLTAGLGVSVPVGEIDERASDLTGTRVQLPFNMQTGSGSWELIPSITFITQNEFGSFGAQVSSTVHLQDNDRDYRLGDRFDATAWASYNVNDWIAVSARLLREDWGSVIGTDPETNPDLDPRANPFSTGGVRTQIPFGVTLYMREGLLRGHRFSLEYYYPVHEDLNGPQLSVNNTLLLGWQVAF